MNNARLQFVAACAAAAVSSFLSEALEYSAFEHATYLALAAIMGLLSVVIVVMAIFAGIRTWGGSGWGTVVFGVAIISYLPFAVEKSLRVNDTQLNVHGLAILGFFLYALISEIAALGFVVALIVRAFRQRGRRDTVAE